MAMAENESVSPASTPAKKSEVPKAEQKKSKAEVPKAEVLRYEAVKSKNDIAVRITSIRNKTQLHYQKLSEDYSKNFVFQTDLISDERQRIIDRLKIIREKCQRNAGKESASSKLPAKTREMTLEDKKNNPPPTSTLPKQKVAPSEMEVIPEVEKGKSLSKFPSMLEKTNAEDNPSSNSPAKKKVTRSSAVAQKVETVTTQKIGGLKRKANASALTPKKKIRKEILFIDLTCDDVEEYFPDKIKINLGHRCDSPAFRLGSINKGVPSTDHGSKVPDKRSSSSTDGAKADGKTSVHKERGSAVREPLQQLRSPDRNKSSSEFKMIRVDYKKNVEQK